MRLVIKKLSTYWAENERGIDETDAELQNYNEQTKTEPENSINLLNKNTLIV